jgi:hypothetical protein
MTTVHRELGTRFPGTRVVVDGVIAGFAAVFNRTVQRRDAGWLETMVAPAAITR